MDTQARRRPARSWGAESRRRPAQNLQTPLRVGLELVRHPKCRRAANGQRGSFAPGDETRRAMSGGAEPADAPDVGGAPRPRASLAGPARREGFGLRGKGASYNRHRLNGYLAQRVPSLFLASCFTMCFNCEVFKGMFPWRTRYPLSQVPIKPVPPTSGERGSRRALEIPTRAFESHSHLPGSAKAHAERPTGTPLAANGYPLEPTAFERSWALSSDSPPEG